MGKTSIEWTTKVWNPTRGCSRVSAGCDHCYAMREARRHDHPGGAYEGLTRVGSRGVDWNGVVRLIPEKLGEPLSWRNPERIFVNSMSDLFHESLPFEKVERVYAVMAEAHKHTFQVLTKRPGRRRAFAAWIHADAKRRGVEAFWPLPNVWEGVSIEDQATADERIPLLLQTPAAVRFVSYEPALGPVDFSRWLPYRHRISATEMGPCLAHSCLDWVIVGGESGPGARPFDLSWARSTITQCRAAGVLVFVKQLGRLPFDGYLSEREVLEGEKGRPRQDQPLTDEQAMVIMESEGHSCIVPRFVLLRDRKGGDMSEWPADLRVREFPGEARS